MRKFINPNKVKFKLAGKVTFIMFYLLLFVLYFLPSSDKPDLIFIILFHFGYALAISFVVVIIIFINGYFAYWHQRILFRTKSLSGIFKKYAFEDYLINANNKWLLTKELKYGFIESYPVIIFRNPTKLAHVIVVVGINWGEDEDMKYQELDRAFNNQDAEIGFAAVAKSVSISDNVEENIKSLINLRRRSSLLATMEKGYE